MKNWKTTAWGIVGIVSLVLSALVQWHSGHPVDLGSLLTQIAGVAAGFGLISAADAKKATEIASEILPK